METDDFSGLFHRYLHNQCTPEEAQYLLDLLAAGRLTASQEALLKEQLLQQQIGTQEDKALDNRLQSRLENIHAQIGTARTTVAHSQTTSFVFLRWAAAALVLLLAGGTWFYTQYKDKGTATPAGVVVHQDVAPGGNRAVLTLANGTTVVLDSAQNGIVAQQGATHVVKLANGQIAYNVTGTAATSMEFNTMITPRGGQYQVTLPDGTRVWLNAASSLKYPVCFNGPERKVDLTGEAYFEVAADVQHPFKVLTNDMEIQVLGTHFNVMAYTDEKNINTTLLEGAVKIVRGEAGHVLHPGQQAILDKQTTMVQLKNADIQQVVAWKNGYFQFDGADLPALLRQIARWYDLDIIYEGAVPDHEFVGRISRNSHLSSVLKALQLSDIHFRIDGKKLIVLPPV